MEHTLIKAINRAGNASKLAAGLGVTRQAVSKWDRIPAEKVVLAEKATGLARHLLRPDLYRGYKRG